ncbi:serine--tRNA ligase [Candidatus Saccharibacteria bacterium]|nr:MAG: serine--tRNA ligase [Candidatus Saccharibacteria bacterium]
MLDIQFIRENAELVQRKSEDKGYREVAVAELLRLDEQRRAQLTAVEELRAQRNTLTESMKGQKPAPDQIAEGKKLKETIAQKEAELKVTEEEWQTHMQAVPNPAFDDVPLGGEEDSAEIKKNGAQETGAKDHLDFAVERGWVDFERGAKVAGTKFYYLKGDLALLENAITQFALDVVLKQDFQYMTVPHLVNSRTAMGAGFSPRGDESGNEYYVEGEDLTLIGTAEAPLTGYHADEIIDEDKLPLKYVGYSPCYRREAGTYGKHTRGLFRVHQFNKLEMYIFCAPEQSRDMHEYILRVEEELWQALGIPYHVVNIAAGDLGAPAAKKYDIEYWSPVDAAYRELTSCSNCTDFQARNLNIRVRRKNGSVEVLHTLNGTAVSLARSLVAVIEHYQTEHGTLKVPDALVPYMGGKTEL